MHCYTQIENLQVFTSGLILNHMLKAISERCVGNDHQSQHSHFHLYKYLHCMSKRPRFSHQGLSSISDLFQMTNQKHLESEGSSNFKSIINCIHSSTVGDNDLFMSYQRGPLTHTQLLINGTHSLISSMYGLNITKQDQPTLLFHNPSFPISFNFLNSPS